MFTTIRLASSFVSSLRVMRRGNGSRRLAKLVAKPEDWQHFLEMAATWDMLAKQRPSDKLAEILGLS